MLTWTRRARERKSTSSSRPEACSTSTLATAVDWWRDVIVLDLGLPDLDGADVLRMLRGVSDVPVIVATARDVETQIVALPATSICWRTSTALKPRSPT